MQRKSPFRRRTQNALSATIKPISSIDAFQHLFGNSLHHLIDAVLSSDQSKKRILEGNKKKLPEADQIRFERIITKIRKHEAELSDILSRGLENVGYPRMFPNTVDGIIERDLEAGTDRLFGSRLVFNLGFERKPHNQGWAEMEEEQWLELLLAETAVRKEYRTQDRHQGKSKFPPLQAMYVRLPPWMAEVVGPHVERRGPAGKEAFIGILKEMAEAFSHEVGVDVIGIAVHRENDKDLHVHLVFSEIRRIRKAPSKRAMLNAIKEAAQARIAQRKSEGKSGSAIGRNTVMKEIRAEFDAKQEEGYVMVRGERRRSWRVLGPAFRGKRALWEMSGREEVVAQTSDRPAHEFHSFRSVVSEPAKQNEDLTTLYIDLWAEQWLTDKASEMLNAEEKQRVATLGKEAVLRYLLWGKEHLSIEDIIRQEIEREYANISGDLPHLRQENHKLIKEAEVLDEAKATFENLAEPLRQSLQRSTFARTVKRTFRMVAKLEDLRSSWNVLAKVAPQIAEVVAKAAAEISVEASTAWTQFWNVLSTLLLPSKPKDKSKRLQEKEPE